MQNVVLFDAPGVRENLLPITYTRTVAHIRVGITTIAEKWQWWLDNYFLPENDLSDGVEISFHTVEYLREKFPPQWVGEEDNLFIAGHVIPSIALCNQLAALEPGQKVTKDGELLAYRGAHIDDTDKAETIEFDDEVLKIHYLYDIFLLNGKVMEQDFREIVADRESEPLCSTNTVIGNPHFSDGTPKIFIEEGAQVAGAFLNVTDGPIYIGKDVEIMEGSCIRAPFAACEHAQVRMGGKVYGATTLGPYCKVGGELNNVVMLGYSNKAHDGFLGNAVIGEWCNLGGGTVCSNLKNDYTEIKLWNYPAKHFLRTGLQFCGVMMGDHTKTGINTMINTATVLGVGVNIHGTGFPRNFVASFSEGSAMGFTDVKMTKFFDIAQRVMARRGKELSEIDKKIFNSIYNIADNYK